MIRKSKRGQVTIFIIIGILIVVGVVLFFILSGDSTEEQPQVDVDIQPIYNYVQGCLDESVDEGIFYIAERGGYYNLSEVQKTDILGIPYYIQNTSITMISKQEMENQLSKSIEDDVSSCVDFKQFEDYEIKSETLTVDSSIEKEKVDVDMEFPLNIRKGENTYQIENFKNTKQIRLGGIYDAISEYINQQSGISEGFCINCFLEISENYDFTVDSFDTSGGSKIFIVSDYNSKLNGEELIYSFAGRF